MDRYSPELESVLLDMSDLTYTVGEKNLATIKDFYSDKGRHFHTWDRALGILSAVLQLGLPDVPRRAHALAAIFCGVVYTVGDKDNELNSVKVMMQMTKGREQESVMGAHDLIMASTKHTIRTQENTSITHRDFLDATLLYLSDTCWPAVVKSDRSDCVERLANGIDLDSMLESRQVYFQNLLAQPTIYLGSHFGSKHEWQTRLNVRRLLAHKHDYQRMLEGIRSTRGISSSRRRVVA